MSDELNIKPVSFFVPRGAGVEREMQVIAQITFTLDSSLVEGCEANVIVYLPAFEKELVPILRSQENLIGETLHHYWGLYDPVKNKRYKMKRFRAKSWCELRTLLRSSLEEIQFKLKNIIIDNLRQVEEMPENKELTIIVLQPEGSGDD